MTPSLIVGDGNWAVKSDSLLGYKTIDGKYYPREMSVVRATTGTRVNEAGLVELVPYNLLTWSQDFSNADWVKSNGPTMTYNSAIAPDGTMTATGIQDTTGGSYKSVLQIKNNISSNSTFTCSIYVKKETSEIAYGGISMYFYGATAVTFYGIFNAVNGTVTLAGSSITPTITVVDLGTYWRIICTATDTGSNTILLFEYYPTLSTNGTTLSQGIGSVRTIWGAQLVEGTQPLDYLPTTTRLNIPRIDYSTGSPALLLEPQRTNVIYPSENFTNANWATSNGATVTENQTIAPNGTLTADKITFPANSSSNIYNFPISSIGLNTISIYAKTLSGTKQFRFRVDTGSGPAVSSDFTATTEWQRFDFVCTTTAAFLVAYIFNDSVGTAGDLFVWGAQLEAGTYPTSYIPTTSASVTRNADSVSKTGISSLIGQTEGTIYLEADIQKHNDSEFYVAISNGASLGEAIYLYQPSSGALNILFRTSGLTPTIAVSSANWDIGLNKIAIAYNLTSGEVFMNGVSKGTVALTALPACSQLTLGARPDAPGNLVGSGGYKVATLFKTRLSNSELATLTTL